MNCSFRESVLQDIRAALDAIERLRETAYDYVPTKPVTPIDFTRLTDEELNAVKIGLAATLESASEWARAHFRDETNGWAR